MEPAQGAAAHGPGSPQSAPPEIPPQAPPIGGIPQAPPAAPEGPSLTPAHEPQPAPPIVDEIEEVTGPQVSVSSADAVRAPVRIGLGLRKTRENFLARIRAALTGAKKADEIYEGLEEALIAADVGVEASMKIAGRRAREAWATTIVPT